MLPLYRGHRGSEKPSDFARVTQRTPGSCPRPPRCLPAALARPSVRPLPLRPAPAHQTLPFLSSQFGCCGVNGPEDFKFASIFRLLTLESAEVPEACCRREPQTRGGVLLSREECLLGRDLFLNKQVVALSPTPGRGRGVQSWAGSHVGPEGRRALWSPTGMSAVMWIPDGADGGGEDEGDRRSSDGPGQSSGHFGWG